MAIFVNMNTEYIYPIKVVVDKTGITAHVIRAWEKRYSAIEPGRTDTNRRLYCEDDIYRLRLLGRLTKAGHSIGTIAGLSTEELEKLGNKAGVKLPDASEASGSFLSDALNAIEDMDEKRLGGILIRASVDLSQPDLIHKLIAPMIKLIGEKWKNGDLRIYHEHLASSVIRSFLYNLTTNYKVEQNAPGIVIATPKGQVHELGALLAATSAGSEGWRVTYLGANLPAEEIAAAVKQNNTRALALSLVYPPDDPDINLELNKLGSYLGNDVIIYAGGNSADSYRKMLVKINAKIFSDLNEFRNELVEVRKK